MEGRNCLKMVLLKLLEKWELEEEQETTTRLSTYLEHIESVSHVQGHNYEKICS
ncbi:hypothetical protein KIN20_032529 [Parelaphostrongylus tenuis]|uniref:Uncharacterized protein n=1 Tax=Parelaphostrongylus tenuis TaxID=148309 RepID=A0AAD5WI50_PARTN|nr:hypothetical protein KIN20_032529 [Parelaphostrongylus tenuis]